MPTSLTRILVGLDERSDVLLDDEGTFTSRQFEVRRRNGEWTLVPRQLPEPTLLSEAAGAVSLNAQDTREAQPLQDDDWIEAGTSLWIFHSGETARSDALEEAALASGADDSPWQVLSDWLQERCDPLGLQIASLRGTRTVQGDLNQRPKLDIFIDMPGGPEFMRQDGFRLEADEEHGVVRRLVARSLARNDADQVQAVLHMRRARFLEHLVMDCATAEAGFAELERWRRLLETWPVPRWLKTLSFGVLHGTAPAGWKAPQPPPRLLERCPRLRNEPLVRWASSARLEVDKSEGVFQLRGLAVGESVRVRTGLMIERRGAEVHVHDGKAKGEPPVRHYGFELENNRWFLTASNWNHRTAADNARPTPKPMTLFVAGERVRRTPLLPDDRIVVEPGLVLRFRVDLEAL